MPGSIIHSFLTGKTIESLPLEYQRRWPAVLEGLTRDYCLYPDSYYGRPDGISPYLCFTDGIPFHYPPSEPVLYNNWEVVSGDEGVSLRALELPENAHHRHCRAGFEFYFDRIASAICQDRMEDAAKFAGAISHTLQDNTTPTHCLEGMDGCDIMLFDRYVRPPEGDPARVPSRIFDRMKPVNVEPLLKCEPPAGRSAREAAFVFYTRFCQTVAQNRFDVLPLIESGYALDEAAWDGRLAGIFRRTIALNAGFLATCHALAEPGTEDFRESLVLSDLRPSRYTRYLSPPYRQTPMIRNGSLTPDGQMVPLELELEPGRAETFQRGLGMGAHAEFLIEHEIPAGVFSHLEGAIGLHARLGGGGKVDMRWEIDDEIVWEDRFDKSHAAARFRIPVAAGGLLRLRGFSRTGRALDPANQVVLAEPILTYPERA